METRVVLKVDKLERRPPRMADAIYKVNGAERKKKSLKNLIKEAPTSKRLSVKDSFGADYSSLV